MEIVQPNSYAHCDLADVRAAALAELQRSAADGMPIKPSLTDFAGEAKPNFEIPYFDLDGKPISYSRRRYLFALFPSKFGEKHDEETDHKYQQPKGSINHGYFPNCIRWRKVLADLADTSRVLLLTEGERKAYASCKAGFPCIGLGGNYGWKVAEKELLLPDLDALPLQGLQIVVVADSDATKREVRQGFDRLCRILKNKGAVVRLLILPALGSGKTGLDDFLVAKGKAALAELVANAAPWRPAVIMVNAMIDVAMDMAEVILSLDPKLYRRGNGLVRLVEDKPAYRKAVTALRRPDSNTYFATADDTCLREDLARAQCVFRSKALKKKENKNE